MLWSSYIYAAAFRHFYLLVADSALPTVFTLQLLKNSSLIQAWAESIADNNLSAETFDLFKVGTGQLSLRRLITTQHL